MPLETVSDSTLYEVAAKALRESMASNTLQEKKPAEKTAGVPKEPLETAPYSTLYEIAANRLRLPSTLPLSQWTEKNITLSSETASEKGPMRLSRTPYLRGVLEAWQDSETEKVVLMTSAQVGKSTTLNVVLGWIVKEQPGPILFVHPTEQIAQDYSRTRISPLFRDSSSLHGLIFDAAKKKKTGDTLLTKEFAGGYLVLAGSNSEAGLSGRPIRYLIGDEISLWENERALALAEARTKTFLQRKIFYASTPTVEGNCAISREYATSDQRKFFAPCPFCNAFQQLLFKQVRLSSAAETIYECRHCKKGIGHERKMEMLQAGEWRATSDTGKKGVAGFWLNEVYSPFVTWENMREKFIEVNRSSNIHMLRDFINLSLGETWKENYLRPEIKRVMECREDYGAGVDVPAGGLVVVAGVDIQDNYIEGEVVAYGMGFQSWGIEHFVLPGDTSRKEVWEKLEKKLSKQYRHVNGQKLSIQAAAIDSGGHFTKEVYQFCLQHEAQRWIAVKGSSSRGKPIITFPTKRIQGVLLYFVGTDTAKDRIYACLRKNLKGEQAQLSWSAAPQAGYDRKYFESLLSETKVLKRTKRGSYFAWVNPKGRGNEALDCRVYSMAALEFLNVDWDALAEKKQPLALAPNLKKRRKVIYHW